MIDNSNDKALHLRVQPNYLNGSVDGRVINAVQQVLTEHSISVQVHPDDNLFQVGLNSLDMLNLVLSLEAVFDVTIPEAEITIANLRTTSTLSSLIGRLLNRAEVVYAK
jgi:acyl carrier protein